MQEPINNQLNQYQPHPILQPADTQHEELQNKRVDLEQDFKRLRNEPSPDPFQALRAVSALPIPVNTVPSTKHRARATDHPPQHVTITQEVDLLETENQDYSSNVLAIIQNHNIFLNYQPLVHPPRPEEYRRTNHPKEKSIMLELLETNRNVIFVHPDRHGNLNRMYI